MPQSTRLAVMMAAMIAAPSMLAAQHHAEPKPAECESAGLDCALFAMPVFAGDDVWLAWSSRNGVFVGRSTDGGRTFPAPVAVAAPVPNLDGGADTRPQLLVLPNRTLVVGYSIFKDDKYNGQVLVARSTDGGRSFSTPRPVTTDPASQRFLSLTADVDGAVFATWIDKRLVAAAKARGEDPAGAALVYAWSRDGGATFGDARVAIDTICECCRLGAVLAQPGRPAILFRNIYGTERDHAILAFEAPDRPDAPEGQQHAEPRAREGQHHALGQQLADDAPTARPEGGAHRHLLLAGSRLRQEQVRDVAAGDQQHAAHGTEQHEQGRLDLARELLVQRHKGRAPALLPRRIQRA